MTTAAASRPEILLDAGTNELEVLVFRLAGGGFGVNVAKVREVIRGIIPTEPPGKHHDVLGMINVRGTLVPLVDLKRALGLGGVAKHEIEDCLVIITEFNGVRIGFLVDAVEQIHRVGWRRVRATPDLRSLAAHPASAAASSCTGVIDFDGRLVLMADFESVAEKLGSGTRLDTSAIEASAEVDRASKRIFIAEDSPFMRQQIRRTAEQAGYTGVELFADGAECWRAIKAIAEDPAQRPLDALISDIEMPQMDGLHLTTLVRAEPAFRDLPIVLFSSLISKDNAKKGEQVGATAQIPKPRLPDLIRVVDLAVTGRHAEIAAAVTAA